MLSNAITVLRSHTLCWRQLHSTLHFKSARLVSNLSLPHVWLFANCCFLPLPPFPPFLFQNSSISRSPVLARHQHRLYACVRLAFIDRVYIIPTPPPRCLRPGAPTLCIPERRRAHQKTRVVQWEHPDRALFFVLACNNNNVLWCCDDTFFYSSSSSNNKTKRARIKVLVLCVVRTHTHNKQNPKVFGGGLCEEGVWEKPASCGVQGRFFCLPRACTTR